MITKIFIYNFSYGVIRSTVIILLVLEFTVILICFT